MLPSWGVLASCYFIALRGNKQGFEEKERKWKWQGNNRSISIIFLHQVIFRLLCHCLRFKETQGELKQFTHSPNCCMSLYLNQRAFKAHYRQSLITHAPYHPYHFCSNMRGTMSPQMYPEQEDSEVTSLQCHRAPGRASCPHHKAELHRGTPSSPQILHHLNTSGPLRRAQACQVLLFSPWPAHKASRCMIQLLVFSSVCPLPQTHLHHLLRSPYSVARGSQLIFRTSPALPGTFYHKSTTPLSPRRHNHAWQRWPSHSTIHPQLFTHSLQLTVTWLPPCSIQSSFLSQSGNFLQEEVTPGWHTSRGWTCVLFPKPIAGCKQLYEGREVTEARQPDPHLSCTTRQLARVCHTSLICTQRYFT